MQWVDPTWIGIIASSHRSVVVQESFSRENALFSMRWCCWGTALIAPEIPSQMTWSWCAAWSRPYHSSWGSNTKVCFGLPYHVEVSHLWAPQGIVVPPSLHMAIVGGLSYWLETFCAQEFQYWWLLQCLEVFPFSWKTPMGPWSIAGHIFTT